MKQIFDEIRGQWVAATPEEIARQTWLQTMTRTLGYPAGLISVEKEIPSLQRRADIICYGSDMQPLILFECKAGLLTSRAMAQAVGYNFHVQAPYVAIVNAEEIRFRYNLHCARCVIRHLPTYQELLHECHLSARRE